MFQEEHGPLSICLFNVTEAEKDKAKEGSTRRNKEKGTGNFNFNFNLVPRNLLLMSDF